MEARCGRTSDIRVLFDIGGDDACQRRSLAHERECSCHRVALAFEHGLDPTVREIAHPAGEPELAGALARGLTEPDALHAPGDDHACVHEVHARRAAVAKTSKPFS